MDPAQEQLFSRFPRRVGTPVQFWVYSRAHFDSFVDRVVGRKNAYSTVGWVNRKAKPVVDKVSLDFDSPEKGSDWGLDEVERLQESSAFADSVLGPVADDVSKMATRMLDNETKALGVFTGFGIHFHVLTEPTIEPRQELSSMPQMYRDEEDLDTMDQVPVGDVWRIMRVPNAQRIEDGEVTSLWTVPLTLDEMEDITPSELLELSKMPRRTVKAETGERRKMEVFNDYLFSRDAVPTEIEELPVDYRDATPEKVRIILEEFLQMPCMYQRIAQPDPKHTVRRNAAVLMFNVGMSVEEVLDIYGQLNWVDWDRSYTKKQLQQIYDTGYRDMTCQSIMREGLCVHMDEPQSCPTYGWSGGQCDWRDVE